MSEKTDAQKIADVLEPYTRHKKSCNYTSSMSTPDGDVCTCGLGDAVDKVNEILRKE